MKKTNVIKTSLVLILISIFFLLNKLFFEGTNLFIIIMIEFILILLCLIFIINRDHMGKIPFWMTITSIIFFIIKSLYSYQTYKTIISPFPDSFKYLSNLNVLLNNNIINFNEIQNITGTSQLFYYYIMYSTIKIFNSQIALYLINNLFFSISCLLFFQIIQKKFNLKIAYITFLISLFSLNFLVFTSNILKDSLVIFLVILTMYLYEFFSKRVYYLIFITISFLIITRIYAGFAILLALSIDMMVVKYSHINYMKKLLLFLGGISFLYIIFNYTLLAEYLTLSKEFVSNYSLFQSIISVPTGIIYMFFAPFPWGIFSGNITIYSIIQIDSAFAMIFSLGLLLFFYKILKFKELRLKIYIYLVPIIVHSLALGLAYEGGSTRQRAGVYFFIILFFVVGIFYKPNSEENSKCVC
ncbi:hypothetical protein [Domibacillus aminovorans]|uniref:Glycosyltransferase RgtA/B/C/D-like domain-containing protein n=1 Tax=Domibacillus aminovorans TaxID=29332 RepID=A0A177L130_9BACI|nr:hypothetical protein [Domibacillus aminovorans]OAH58965.1 hypothetical protein AWH49_04690 [Domibacillus aminovorans]